MIFVWVGTDCIFIDQTDAGPALISKIRVNKWFFKRWTLLAEWALALYLYIILQSFQQGP